VPSAEKVTCIKLMVSDKICAKQHKLSSMHLLNFVLLNGADELGIAPVLDATR
jgi:hypothetical protein